MRLKRQRHGRLAVIYVLVCAAAAAAADVGEGLILLKLKESSEAAAPGSWDAGLASAECEAAAGGEWAADTPPCGDGATAKWRGVTCSTQGAVTDIALPGCGLQGSLPAELAQLAQLRVLDLQRNSLTGGVPPAWTAAGAFPALEELQLAGNQLSGGLDEFSMASGGFIAAKAFNVSGNAFGASPLPGEWYSPSLLALDVAYTGLSGPLPVEWGEPVAGQATHFPALQLLYIQGNNLSGPADPWPQGSANIFGPGFLCIGEPGNPYLEMMEAPAADDGTAAADAAALLALKASAANWDAALATEGCEAPAGAAWLAGTPPCGGAGGAGRWRGVGCSEDGAVTELTLAGCGLEGSLPGELASMPQLKALDLQRNSLTGGVPPAWTAAGAFPVLEELQLAKNNLSGGLDDFSMALSGFIATKTFNVSTNAFNQSELPAGWYSRTLLLIDVAYNGVSGPVPAEWGEPKAGHADAYPSAFPSLQRLALEGNNLSGPADPWPRGSANTFAPGFLCTSKPGNPYLEMEPAGSPSDGSSSGGGGLSAGAIAGIAVGAAAGVALLAGAALLVVRRRRAAAGSPAPPKTGHASAADGSVGGGDVEGGGKPLFRGSGGAASVAGSAFEAKPLGKRGSGGEHRSDLSSGALLAGTGSDWSSAAGSGRTFGSMLVDTDARRLPAEWNTVLFSELEMDTSVGAGSFGSVWRAKYCSTSVAVKLLGTDKAPGASDTSYQRRITRQLEKEAGIMSKLRHTNICLYMGVCLEPPCLLMEYCARRSVDSLLAQGLKEAKAAKQLSWPRLLSMASDAAKGMVYLHTRSPPVYHRDLKSANLLVTSQWQVKVADFNLSRALEPTDFMSSLCIQNPRWLAPEVLAGEEGGLPADVWAFGTVLWELMTWRAPFEGMNPYQIINIVQAAPTGSGLELPAPEALPAGELGQYGAYVELVGACWARDPAARPTFEEVVNRLRAIMQAEMRRHHISSSPLGSAQGGGSPHPTVAASSAPPSAEPSALPADACLQSALASSVGTHRSFEAATQATSRAFQEALRDSFSAERDGQAAGVPPSAEER